jgi:hypothetical protein
MNIENSVTELMYSVGWDGIASGERAGDVRMIKSCDLLFWETSL